MAQGTIKKLMADKGFGFIKGATGDVFFHATALQDASIDNLIIGQTVDYDESSSDKGPRAENVVVR